MHPRSVKSRRLPLAVSISKLCSTLSLSAVLTTVGGIATVGASLYWDPLGNLNGPGDSGGSGTWNTSLSNWDDNFSPTDVQWTNGNLDTAIFGGTGGTVSVALGVTAGEIDFNVSGYTLTGGPLILNGGGTAATIAVNASGTTTISAPITATYGLTITGAGTLVLSGTNNIGGTTTLLGGTVVTNLSSGVNNIGNTALLLAGGTLQINPTATTTTNGLSGRVFTGTATTSDSALINFAATANSTRTDANLNAAAISTANTAIQWTGKVNITTAGPYTFFSKSDEGSRIYIDGVLVLNNDGNKSSVTDDGSIAITLTSGLHDIVIDYINGSGTGSETLSYSGPDSGGSETVIPSSALFSAESNTTAGASNALILGSGSGNAVSVSSDSTIALKGSNFTQVQIGSLELGSGATLTVSGDAGKTLRVAGTTSLGSSQGFFSGGTVTLNNGVNIALDGPLTDGGMASTLVLGETGYVIFDHTSSANSVLSTSTIDIQKGAAILVGSSAAGAFDPIGAASIRLDGGNLILDTSYSGAISFNNAISVPVGGTIRDTVTASTVTLGSATRGISIASGQTLTLDAIAGGIGSSDPGATLALAGPLTGDVTTTVSLISSVLGTNTSVVRGGFIFSGDNSGFKGTINIASGPTATFSGVKALQGASLQLAGNTISFLADGNGSGGRETFLYNDQITTIGSSTINVGRQGSAFAPLFTQAANKVAQMGAYNTGGNSLTLTVNNNNGYGLAFNGPVTINNSALTFSVTNASVSTAIPGLALIGVVGGNNGFTKSGAGTLLLTNSGNTFLGNTTSAVNITAGVLGATNDGAFGAPSNGIIINGSSAVLEAFASFSTSRAITLNSSTNTIAATSGNTFTLNAPLLVQSAGNGLTKTDNGTVVLAVDNPSASGASPTWTGTLTISAGAVQMVTANSAGGTTLSVTSPGAALQLTGSGITYGSNSITLSGSGINSAGALENVSGANTWNSGVTLSSSASIGADSGSSLTISGIITGLSQNLTLTGAGNGTITTPIGIGTGNVTQVSTGTWTLTAAQSLTGGYNVDAGTLVFSGSATNPAAGGSFAVNYGASLTFDDTGTNISSRNGGHLLTMTAGQLNLKGAASATSAETFSGMTFGRGEDIVNLVAGATGQANVILSSSTGGISRGSFSTVVFQGTNLSASTGSGLSTISLGSGTGGSVSFTGVGAAGSPNKACFHGHW